MARRRKKTAKGLSAKKPMDKALPAIPPPEARHTAYMSPSVDQIADPLHAAPMPEGPSVQKTMSELRHDGDSEHTSPPASSHNQQAGLTLPSTTYKDNRKSHMSQRSDMSGGGEEFLIPLAFDPNPRKPASNSPSQQSTPQVRPTEDLAKDYFGGPRSHTLAGSTSQATSPQIPQTRQPSHNHVRKQSDASPSRHGSRAASSYAAPGQHHSPHISQLARNDSSMDENFKLQEAPKNRRVPSSSSTPQQDLTPNLAQQRSPALGEQDFRSDGGRSTPRMSHEASPEFIDEFNSPPRPPASRSIPARGDSLASSVPKTIPRKEVSAGTSSQPLHDMSNTPGPKPPPTNLDAAKANGGKVISAPISSPGSQSIHDTPSLLQEPIGGDKFVQPRAPPAPPSAHARNESISTLQSDAQRSPKLPRYSGQGDFTLEEDISRILGLDDGPTANESFLRRVSNSVRHGRSYSAQSGGRFSRDRWPRSPVVTTAAGHEISSPSTASPEHREELAWFKNELRRERQKTMDREKKIAELETQLNATADISQVNVELKEKRSTMVVLDTQKEIVVRELEVLTEHIANAKKSGEPLDVNKMNSTVLRDLAEALDRLKRAFTPQIESLVQQKNELLDDITQLNQQKDKSFHEFEQLSNKNAQLAEFNNQLVDQIQNIYKSNRGTALDELKQPNGLGIYSHHKDNSKVSIDSREMKPMQPPIMDPGITYEAGEAGAIQSLAGAQVVEMKKGAVAKRFDWRKGQKMAKGITKGVKGAFASAQQNYGRDMSFAETGAYGNQISGGQPYTDTPKNAMEFSQQAGWLSANQKPGRNGLYASSANASTPSLLAGADNGRLPLYGTDLETRADYEKSSIPGIVKRCIAEVEDRGMDVEGIYRKSGGNSQVQQVKEGFERQPYDYDISDPDLDIHAVTSGLKQYFRKLPTPLITYDVYDTLIELTMIPDGPNQREHRIAGLRDALEELPRVHYEILDYLMRHLSRVVVFEKENLMTPMNVAVVFAPTIMRPESVARELSDTKGKNEVIMWMVNEGAAVFGWDESETGSGRS